MKAKNLKVVLSGRFQPFHAGHKKSYDHLVDKFGKKSVYIATSNKVDSDKSPFTFDEKKRIITTMYPDISPNHVVQVKNPYNPSEILISDNFIYIAVVGFKDAGRLSKGRYFKTYSEDIPLETNTTHGYVYVIPETNTQNEVSGTMVRKSLRDLEYKKALKFFKKIYKKNNQEIFDFIRNSLHKPINEELLVEGGGFGHLDNIWDVDFSFQELKNLINDSLQGNLQKQSLKTDGQNLMFTVIRGEVFWARNKGHIKNFGINALNSNELKLKFANRGGLTDAFNHAVADIVAGIAQITPRKLKTLFKDGRVFMSMEVMYTESENLIHYGNNQIRFHGSFEYDEDGTIISKQSHENAEELSRLMKKFSPKTYTINSLKSIKLPKVPDFDKQQTKFQNLLSKLQKKYLLHDNQTIGDYKRTYIQLLLFNKDIVDVDLVNRWAFGNKKYTIKKIRKKYKDTPDLLDWIIKYEKKELKGEYKKMMEPLEHLFLQLGSVILQNITEFMVINPEKTIQKLKVDFEAAIKELSKTKDPKKINILKRELKRFQKAGGANAIIPEEGITFFWNGKFLKYTGTFSPMNQIIGMLRFV